MKLPPKTKRHCPYCRKHTEHTVGTAKQRSRSSARPMSRWGASRVKARNYKSGTGNLGRFSKPPVKNWKRKAKVTRRITIEYKCGECKKIHQLAKSIRTSRVQIGEKVAK